MTMAIVPELIEAHRAAVVADEAMFTEDGTCLAEDGSSWVTQAAEEKAFIGLVDCPCRSAGEVALKVDYFVNGTIGDRTSLIGYLTEYDYGEDGLTARLLKSMVVDEPTTTPGFFGHLWLRIAGACWSFRARRELRAAKRRPGHHAYRVWLRNRGRL